MTRPNRFDSLSFLHRLLAGGRAAEVAAADFVEHYRPVLTRRFRAAGVAPEALDDLVSEVLITAVTQAHTVRVPQAFHQWVMTIAEHTTGAHWHERARERALFGHATPQADSDADSDWMLQLPDHGATDHTTRLCLQGQFAKFRRDEPQRHACIEYLTHGHDQREIAELIGRTYGATRQYLSQCCARLLEYLRPCLGEDDVEALRRGGARS